MKTTLVATLLSSVLAAKVSCDTFTIHDAAGFYKLAEDVNSGTSYAGTTVLLEADVDFTNNTEGYAPIGGVFGYDYRPFEGVFDGQGHTISNFVLNSTERYPSLFGMINGTGFRNLVVDSSCSITGWFEFIINSTSYSGGLISYLYPTKKTPGKVEGCVNMASIAFFGNATNSPLDNTITLLGGIVGYVIPFKKSVDISNCVNYGSILYRGAVQMASLGGIAGAYFMDSFSTEIKCNVRNCANFGNLTQEGTVDNMLALGGIAGTSIGGDIVNCITYGAFFNIKETDSKAKIVGGVTQKVTISHCYWANEVDSDSAYGHAYGLDPTVEESGLVEPNSATMSDLNAWVSSNGENDYVKWVMLHLEGGEVNGIYGDTAITLKKLVAAPIREGYKFVAWCADEDCVEEYNESSEAVTDIYASWEIGNYTIRFDFGNGTVIEAWYEYNSTITYPNMKGVKGFYGWNVTFERMPGHDLVVGFKDKEAKSKGPNPGTIAGGVVGGVALLAIIVLVFIFLVLLRAKGDGKEIEMKKTDGVDAQTGSANSRFIENCRGSCIGPLALSGARGDPNMYADVYPGNYATPSISEALTEAGLSGAEAKQVVEECGLAARRAAEEGEMVCGITMDDAAAVALYTYDFGPGMFESNPYNLINSALTGNSADLTRVRGLFYVVMRALRKLPRYGGMTLYRGIRGDVNKSLYSVGNVVVFHGLSSTSTSMKTVKEFLGSSGNSGESEKVSGTLFVIEGAWGYDIQPYSLFPDEKEILLEPERSFCVQSVIESDTTVVGLKLVETPLILPRVFDSGNCTVYTQ